MLGRRSFLGACIGAVAASSKVPPVEESSLSFTIHASEMKLSAPINPAGYLEKEFEEAADHLFSMMTVPGVTFYFDRDYTKNVSQTGDTITLPFRFVRQEQK